MPRFCYRGPSPGRALLRALGVLTFDTPLCHREIMALRWSDVDLAAGYVVFGSRWVQISARAVAALAAMPRLGDKVFDVQQEGGAL